jgi:hypothetical protein
MDQDHTGDINCLHNNVPTLPQSNMTDNPVHGYRKAAANGSSQAMGRLGCCYEMGDLGGARVLFYYKYFLSHNNPPILPHPQFRARVFITSSY